MSPARPRRHSPAGVVPGGGQQVTRASPASSKVQVSAAVCPSPVLRGAQLSWVQFRERAVTVKTLENAANCREPPPAIAP